MIIRKVQASDAPSIVELYSFYVLNSTVTFDSVPPSIEKTAELIKEISESYPFLVAIDSNYRLIGYAYAHSWKEKAAYSRTWELTIYIAENETAHGIGHELARQLISTCFRAGCHSLVACITAENIGSIRFHERLGFKKVSLFREVGFKFGRYLDVVDLELLG